MLVSMNELLKDAEEKNYAIASINSVNLETIQALVWAAEEVGVGIALSFAQNQEEVIPLEIIAPHMIEYAKAAKVPIAVHLDHGLDFDYCMRAVRAGFTSIMFDKSDLPIEENIKQTRRFVDIVRPLGISVEAELGEMPNNMSSEVDGQEKSDLSDLTKYFTDPDEALHFAKETGVDILAISIGTVHGIYEDEPNLDLERISKIYNSFKDAGIKTHLGIHGASGTPEKMLKDAVKHGIRKVNYFTALDSAPAAKIVEFINSKEGMPVHYSHIVNVARDTMQEHAKKVLKSLM